MKIIRVIEKFASCRLIRCVYVERMCFLDLYRDYDEFLNELPCWQRM